MTNTIRIANTMIRLFTRACASEEVLFGRSFIRQIHVGYIIHTSKEPVCPRVELILKIIIILLIIFLGFIKSKPC